MVQFPVFDTHTVTTVATLSSGATVVFGRDEEHLFARKSLRFAKGEAEHEDPLGEDEERMLLVFVTATLVNPSPAAPARTGGTKGHLSATGAPGIYKVDPQSSQPTTGSPASLPSGVPVPGKPGFVTSPYAPDAGYVDLRGFTSGQSVRDPFTGKLFLVP